MESDTIVAVATPPGEGGVGVIRASGPLAPALAPRLFPRLSHRWETHHLRHGTMVDPFTGERVDDAMACVMHAPRSYTGEDCCEFHCHGSPLVLDRVIQLCLALGCRAARPGEFTLRAFLNGRMDLSQAEAVVDVVRARTNTGLRLAMQQMSGWLSAQVEPLRDELMGALAHMEAMVDFVEDDIPPQLDAGTRTRLELVRTAVDTLAAGVRQGLVVREGAALTIAGSPNVGKSSLLNALAGSDRSIVTPVAGTTRDTVEETIDIRGVPFRTIDTAGLTETDDLVEQLGVERSRQAIAAADVVLYVLDRSRPWSGQEAHALDTLVAAIDGHAVPVVLTINKCDLPAVLDPALAIDRLGPAAVVESTALRPGGIDALRSALSTAVAGRDEAEWVSGNARHHDALTRASAALRAAGRELGCGMPLDLIALDVRAAAQALGEISGVSVDDELLDRIFRDFCIGK